MSNDVFFFVHYHNSVPVSHICSLPGTHQLFPNHCCLYSGTPLMRTPLGPAQKVLIRKVSLFQGLFYIHKIRLGPHAVSAFQGVSTFQGCPQGRAPLYIFIYMVASKNTLRLLLLTAASHLNKLSSTFAVQFQLMPITCKILFG